MNLEILSGTAWYWSARYPLYLMWKRDDGIKLANYNFCADIMQDDVSYYCENLFSIFQLDICERTWQSSRAIFFSSNSAKSSSTLTAIVLNYNNNNNNKNNNNSIDNNNNNNDNNSNNNNNNNDNKNGDNVNNINSNIVLNWRKIL